MGFPLYLTQPIGIQLIHSSVIIVRVESVNQCLNNQHQFSNVRQHFLFVSMKVLNHPGQWWDLKYWFYERERFAHVLALHPHACITHKDRPWCQR